jgi:hypothetical protein
MSQAHIDGIEPGSSGYIKKVTPLERCIKKVNAAARTFAEPEGGCGPPA